MLGNFSYILSSAEIYFSKSTAHFKVNMTPFVSRFPDFSLCSSRRIINRCFKNPMLFIRPLIRLRNEILIFLFLWQPKDMLWVLKRTISMRWFFHLNEMVLLSTQNICWNWWVRQLHNFTLKNPTPFSSTRFGNQHSKGSEGVFQRHGPTQDWLQLHGYRRWRLHQSGFQQEKGRGKKRVALKLDGRKKTKNRNGSPWGKAEEKVCFLFCVTRDCPTFLRSGPGACWIWVKNIWIIKIGKIWPRLQKVRKIPDYFFLNV